MTRRTVAIAVAVVIVAIGAVVLLLDRSTTLDKAIDKIGDDKAFTTSTRAGQAFADISTLLRDEGVRCRDDNKAKARCDAILSTAGFSAVNAVALLDCTAPDVFAARRAFATYLRSLRTFLNGDAKAAPELPEVVTC